MKTWIWLQLTENVNQSVFVPSIVFITSVQRGEGIERMYHKKSTKDLTAK